jgi:hypothetical protein
VFQSADRDGQPYRWTGLRFERRRPRRCRRYLGFVSCGCGPDAGRGRDALTRRCLELVEAVEEGAEPAEIAAIKRDAEAGEGGEFGFIGFLGVGSAGGDEGLGAEDIVKIFVETDESASGDLALHPNEHDVPDIAIGVKVVVEVDHFSAGEFEIVGNFKEGEVFFRNETISK